MDLNEKEHGSLMEAIQSVTYAALKRQMLRKAVERVEEVAKKNFPGKKVRIKVPVDFFDKKM